MGYNGDPILLAYTDDPDVYGPGTDGDVVLNGAAITVDGVSISPSANVYTLTRELYARNLTINAPYSLRAAGFSVRVNGTLSGDAGTNINDNGNNAAGATTVSGLSSTNQLSGRFSGASGAGRTSTAGNGSNATTFANAGGAAGGSGGGSGAFTGGTAAVTLRVDRGRPDDSSLVVFSRIRPQGNAFNGGGGGGGGARNTGGSGGAGGSGGGFLQVFARVYNYQGTLAARGGNGANGTTDSGGGGGGGGGVVVLVTSQELVPPVLDASGGNPGNGAGGGLPGNAGNPGFTFYGRLG